jgi:hypothetical protein
VDTAEFSELSDEEKEHFYKCQKCGHMVDKRQLDDVLFHEDHLHRPDIEYSGSERLSSSMEGAPRLANRFGKTYHRSYLRKKLERLRDHDPEAMPGFEELLIKVAQMRADNVPGGPSVADVPNEELIVALFLLENVDRPGLLESAALLLSRLPLDQKELTRLAKQERVDFLLPKINGAV